MAGSADDISYAAMRADFLEFDSRPGEGILHPAADHGNGADRRVHVAGFVSLLFFLGSDAHPDGSADWNFRPRAQSLCRDQVFHVHDDCIGVHAGGDPVALCAYGQL